MIQVLDENSIENVRVKSKEDKNPRYFEAYISALPDRFHSPSYLYTGQVSMRLVSIKESTQLMSWPCESLASDSSLGYVWGSMTSACMTSPSCKPNTEGSNSVE